MLLNVVKGEETAAFEGRVTEDGKALFVIPNFVLLEAGTVACDVSALTLDGCRLTSSKFEIVVEPAVCLADEFGTATDIGNFGTEFLAGQLLNPLLPSAGAAGYILRPEVNRKYTVDLSDASYAPDGNWARFALELPLPKDPMRENWVLLCFHAPVQNPGGGISFDFGSNVLFSDGVAPFITMSDFEILCTFSPMTSLWHVGVVQYGIEGGTV